MSYAFGVFVYEKRTAYGAEFSAKTAESQNISLRNFAENFAIFAVK